jgi:hypothetical protein
MLPGYAWIEMAWLKEENTHSMEQPHTISILATLAVIYAAHKVDWCVVAELRGSRLKISATAAATKRIEEKSSPR